MQTAESSLGERMTKAEVSWYDEDDHCEVEEDLDLIEDTVNQKKKVKGVQCPKCKKVLSRLEAHLRSVRPCTIPKPPKKATQIKYKPSQCPECKKVFTQRVNMKIHLKSIHQGIKVKCDYCGKTATTKSNLKKHIRLYCPSKPV